MRRHWSRCPGSERPTYTEIGSVEPVMSARIDDGFHHRDLQVSSSATLTLAPSFSLCLTSLQCPPGPSPSGPAEAAGNSGGKDPLLSDGGFRAAASHVVWPVGSHTLLPARLPSEAKPFDLVCIGDVPRQARDRRTRERSHRRDGARTLVDTNGGSLSLPSKLPIELADPLEKCAMLPEQPALLLKVEHLTNGCTFHVVRYQCQTGRSGRSSGGNSPGRRQFPGSGLPIRMAGRFPIHPLPASLPCYSLLDLRVPAARRRLLPDYAERVPRLWIPYLGDACRALPRKPRSGPSRCRVPQATLASRASRFGEATRRGP